VDYAEVDLSIHFWRTRAGTEVDFILYGGAGFYAIEVKNSISVRPEDLRGLRSFLQDYREAEAFLLYRGDETLERDGIRCMPVDRFLRALVPGESFPR
jgi:predicted AAA+ superfamily ATPase